MKIHELCGDCKHFEHECDYDMCFEFCRNPNKEIVDKFIDSLGYEEITHCEGFEKE